MQHCHHVGDSVCRGLTLQATPLPSRSRIAWVLTNSQGIPGVGGDTVATGVEGGAPVATGVGGGVSTGAGGASGTGVDTAVGEGTTGDGMSGTDPVAGADRVWVRAAWHGRGWPLGAFHALGLVIVCQFYVTSLSPPHIHRGRSWLEYT